jgi:4'-phosphopantetheinyl transferase
LTTVSGWHAPPEHPVLGTGDAAVWLLSREAATPIESVAARYLDLSPRSVRVVRSPTGKPELDGSDLTVGLAHSGEAVLVAIASSGDVGVDVEALRSDAAGWALVDHALTEGERAPLEALAPPDRAEAFLRTWTRKEAILKAAGVGLGLDPRRVELDGLAVVAAPPELGRGSDWTLADIPLAGHAAALALRGRLNGLNLYDAQS